MRNLLYYIQALFLIVALTPVGTKAQDPNFTQYFASPMTLNPALIGKGVVDWRLMSNYRTQWFGNSGSFPFHTATISLEKRLSQDKIGNNQFAIGGMLLSDESNAGLLKNNYASIGVSYNNALDEAGDLLFGAGLMLNYHNRILDPSKFIFQSQFGSFGYQPTAGIPDGVNIARSSYFDMNLGIHLSQKKKSFAYGLGISYFHAAQPSDGAYSKNEHYIYPRLSTQGFLNFFIRNKDEIEFSYLVNHQVTGGENPDIFMLGALYKIQVGDNDAIINKLNIGAWNRFNQSASAYIGLQGKSHWLLGVSYDFVINDQKTSFTNYQSLECSFSWQFAGKKQKTNLSALSHVISY